MKVYCFYPKRKQLLLLGIGLLAALTFFIRLGRENTQATIKPVYQGNEKEKTICLMVNVFWGEQYIQPMLDIFKQEGIPATFFIGGTWAKDFPDLVKEIAAAKQEIGSHGYAHPHPDNLSKTDNIKDIKKAEEIIYKTTGKRPLLYAPPYGEKGPSVLKAAEETGYKFILWSVDTIDWQKPDPSVIVQRVLGKAHNGAFVLMHPTAPTVQALPTIIKDLKQKGYKFVTVGQALKELPPDQGEGQKK